MRYETPIRQPEIVTVNSTSEALEKVDQLLEHYGLEVIMWANGIPHPHYSFSIVSREP